MRTLSQKRSSVLVALSAIIGVLGFLGTGIVASAAFSSILLPNADGYSLQWALSSGTSTHYTLVDESTCNGVTDYVQTTTVGQRDAFAVSLAGIPDGSTITAVAIKPCASRASTVGTNPIMNVFYRLSGVNSADAGAYALTGTTPSERATTTIAVASSTIKTATTTLQVGVVLTSGTKGARLSRIATQVTYTAPAPSAPNAPSALSGTPHGSLVRIDLGWTDNASNETAFAVERKLAASSTYAQIASTSANVIAYADTGVTQGSTYNYRVRAYNTAGYSAYSNVATATAPVFPPAPPNAPNMTAYSATSTPNDVQLSFFSASTTYYTIERSFTSTTSYAFLATTTNAFYTDVAPGSGTWWYRATASNVNGTSGYGTADFETLP